MMAMGIHPMSGIEVVRYPQSAEVLRRNVHDPSTLCERVAGVSGDEVLDEYGSSGFVGLRRYNGFKSFSDGLRLSQLRMVSLMRNKYMWRYSVTKGRDSVEVKRSRDKHSTPPQLRTNYSCVGTT